MNPILELLELLARAEVRYIVVGGVAGTLHGAARLTQDLDVVYDRNPENLKRLARALDPLTPYPRGAPPDLPFRWGVQTLQNGLNFTLQTSLGGLDLLGEIAGGGSFDDLEPHAIDL